MDQVEVPVNLLKGPAFVSKMAGFPINANLFSMESATVLSLKLGPHRSTLSRCWQEFFDVMTKGTHISLGTLSL